MLNAKKEFMKSAAMLVAGAAFALSNAVHATDFLTYASMSPDQRSDIQADAMLAEYNDASSKGNAVQAQCYLDKFTNETDELATLNVGLRILSDQEGIIVIDGREETVSVEDAVSNVMKNSCDQNTLALK